MKAQVLGLEQVGAGHAARVGGKAANLGEMLGQGFPVPAGFVITADACAEAVAQLGLGDALRRLRDLPPEEREERCQAVRRRVASAELDSGLVAQIRGAHERLLAGRGDRVLCAVRSSALAEDLGGASFAGQHGTYYYVVAATLLERVRQCWASLWGSAAVSYRAAHGIDEAAVAMAVIVQEMIPSEVSGVAFTVNPVTGARDELVIESSWGMGAALVDGRVTPDRWVLARDGLAVRQQRIAEKRFMVASRVPPGREARLEEIPHGDRRRETLTPELLRTVAQWSLEAEAHFGAPQDVEWALSGERIHVLQSRPITVTGREDIGRGVAGRWVLFKPVVENFTDPLTPLTEDAFLSMRPPGFRSIRGWLYVDVDLVRRLLPFDLSAEETAKLLYAFSSGAARPLRLAPARLPVAGLVGLLGWLVMAVTLARSRSLPDDALDGFRARCRKVEEDPSLGLRDALGRLFLYPRVNDPISHLILLVNGCSMRFLPWMAVLRALVRRWAPALRADAEALLTAGSEGVLSAEMGRGLWRLAQDARGRPRVREILLAARPERALGELLHEPEARPFLDALYAFLAVNGHRALKEFELRSPRWEEDPAPVLGMIRNYLLLEGGPERPEARASAARAQAFAELRAALAPRFLEGALGWRRRLIAHAAARVRYFLKLRENSRFFHIMAFAMLRRKALRLEADLLRQGRLKCADDIFFLYGDEVELLAAGRLGWADVEDRIRERRIDHVRLSKMGPPKTIGLTYPEAASAPEGEGTVLQGQAASPGRYEGMARVILDPSTDVELRPGEVLVAPYTDPAWTPLFLTAGAAVVEVGSYLSHAGTVAREFGMPCVVDVTGATRLIRNGERVAVDGDRGIVRLLSAAEEVA
ncbi:MAG TPA: PEP/pyruvate-binding domain-containing protein [Vicinamibacteria bacterium]